MQFNTYLYVLTFLPLTIICYYIICKYSYNAAKVFLIVVSMFFYSYAGIKGFYWLLISIFLNYLFSCILKKQKSKLVLWVGISINIILLVYFKYTNFVIATINQLFNKNIGDLNIILPIGISFFTFQQISYIVDTYWEKTLQNSLLDYLLYITFFPKILMGPIVKQSDLIPQFNDESKRKLSYENLVDGIQMFIIGLFKKVILADTFSLAVAWAYSLGDFSKITAMDTFLVIMAYTFQIYFDFSGYSDMAIASARMLNINLSINFDSPYKALSIRDFWKRWHISLSKFLTEYVYIPLGGNRKGKIRTIINTMIVFLVSGLWHGANWTFVLWGLLNGVLSILDRMTEKYRKNVHPALKWISTFIIVSFLWSLFQSNSITEWKNMIVQMLKFNDTSISTGLINCFILPETSFLNWLFKLKYFSVRIRGFWMILFYLMSIILCLGFENTYKMKHKKSILTAFYYGTLFIFTLTCIGTETVFVYFGF